MEHRLQMISSNEFQHLLFSAEYIMVPKTDVPLVFFSSVSLAEGTVLQKLNRSLIYGCNTNENNQFPLKKLYTFKIQHSYLN